MLAMNHLDEGSVIIYAPINFSIGWRMTAPMRNPAYHLACILSTFVGIAGLVGSAATLQLFLTGNLYTSPLIGTVFRSLEGLTTYVGILVVSASLFHLAVGVLLWKGKKVGAFLGFALSFFEALCYPSILFLPNLALPMTFFLAVGTCLSLVLLLSWDPLS